MGEQLSTLAGALARLATGDDGLHAMYLPEHLGDLAEQVVRAANLIRPLDDGGQPFAVVVDENREADESGTDCRRVSMGGLIKYRTGNRLAVVDGPHSVPASIAGAFVKIPVSIDFPGSASERDRRLELLAERAIEALLAPFPGAGDFMDRAAASARLSRVMTVLASSYESLAQGAAPWNFYWFRHVESGLESLSAVLDQAASGGGDELDKLFTNTTYAAFGLPTPASGIDYGRGRSVVDALTGHWATTDGVLLSLDHLLLHPSRAEEDQGHPHPLAAIDFTDYDARIAAADNVLLAWGAAHKSTVGHLEAFRALTESQFFAPDQNLEAPLVLTSEDGNALGIEAADSTLTPMPSTGDDGDDTGPQFVVFEWDEGALRSENLRVVIPTVFLPDDLDVTTSRLALSSTGKGSWSGTLAIEEGQLVATGALTLACTSRKRMVKKPVVLSASIPPGDVLAGLVGKPSSPPLYPMVEGGVGIWSFEQTKQGGYKTGIYRGYEDVQECLDDAGLQVPVDTNVDIAVRVVTWGPAEGVAPVDTRPIRIDLEALKVNVTDPDLVTNGENEFVVGNLAVKWTGEQSTAEYLSPLVAAAQGGALSAGEPDQRLVESLRGRIESFLTGAIDSDPLIDAHGHLVLIADSPELPDSFEASAGGAVLTVVGDSRRFSAATNFGVSAELRDSPEAENFRDAARKLRLGDRMTMRGKKDESPTVVWPSRTSWEELHGSSELEDYLNTYRALVDRASSGSSRDRFWATFPFSVVVYGSGSADAQTVLLTPLHPLRLAWLAAAEASLRQGANSQHLAGILEAWNLPLVGPQPNSPNGRVVAVPADAGSGQLFLGWSMMVRVSVAGPHALEPPARVGALAAPGSSVTGLNSDAVKSALTTFHRMNPHVATLSIDLASSVPGARLEEIDDAIVDAISRPERALLRGGVRVHDSMNRIGDAPIEELERRLAAGAERPVRWSRYRDGGRAPSSNLRFLQDAGVKVEVSPTGKPGAGLLSAVPLRRLSVPVLSEGTDNSAVSYPAVELNDRSTPYERALFAAERVDQGVQMKVELFRAALVNDSADWTVTGESLLGASALAELLTTDGNGQMLWEWRPPYLSRNDAARLDARPFVSVVRMPQAFKSQVARGVGKAAGAADHEAGVPLVAQVMSTLGARGIGLSTLMAQGGTHAAGAIGFYLALRFAELCEIEGYQLLSLPIDACDEFLRALAGETASANQLRRADLLLLAVSRDEVVLIPVEIKCYGLESSNPPPNLPSSSSQLAEPLEQLESTAALVQQLVQRYGELSKEEPATAALWRHGFATMVEAAVRLHPSPTTAHQDLVDVLSGILSGEAAVRSGGSLVTFFGHEATSPDGASHLVLKDIESPNDPAAPLAGALLANTQSAFRSASSGVGQMVESWSELVGWAVTDPGRHDKTTVVLVSEEASGSTDDRIDGGPVDRSAESARPEPVKEGEDVQLGDHREQLRDEVGPDIEPAELEVPETTEVEAIATKRADGILGDGVRFTMGQTLDGVKRTDVDFWPSNTALNQMNVGVIGDLGTGKTQFLKALVRQLRKEAARTQPTPVSMLIFDYKRDYQDDAFLSDVGGSLLRPFHIPLDVLAINGDYTPQKAVQSASAFIDVIAKIYAGIGPIQRNNLLFIIKRLFQESGGVAPTIGQIVSEYEEANGVDSVVAVLNGFVLNEVFSEDRSQLVPMEELLHDNVLVLAVSDLGADEKMKTALITLFLNKYYEYMLRLTKWPYEGEAPRQLRRLNSFVLVDEATNIMKHEFPVLSQLLLQGREFGVGVILASQFVSHFKVGATRYGETLLTKVIHKVPDTKVTDLKAFGISTATQQMADRIPLLPVHQALCKTWGVEGRFMRGTPYFELAEDG